MDRVELINQARRLASEHVENARILQGNRYKQLSKLEPQEAIRELAGDCLQEAHVDLLTE